MDRTDPLLRIRGVVEAERKRLSGTGKRRCDRLSIDGAWFAVFAATGDERYEHQ